METISKLITDNSWNLISWNERYGNGVWVAVGPVINHLYEMREVNIGSDIESIELGFYLHNEGSWLPTAYSLDLATALAALETKIQAVASSEMWRDAVYKAFECIYDENDGSYGLKNAVENKNPLLYPPKP